MKSIEDTWLKSWRHQIISYYTRRTTEAYTSTNQRLGYLQDWKVDSVDRGISLAHFGWAYCIYCTAHFVTAKRAKIIPSLLFSSVGRWQIQSSAVMHNSSRKSSFVRSPQRLRIRSSRAIPFRG